MAPEDSSTQETQLLDQETQLLDQETQLLAQDTQSLETPTFDTIQPPAEDEQEALAALKALEDRRAARRRSVIIKAGAAAGALALALGGFFFVRSVLNKPKSNSPYETAVASYDSFKVSVQGSGALQPYAQVVVTPEVDGIIDTVIVTQGQQVKAGDVLFTLRNSEIDKAIADAEEAYTKAQNELSKAYEALSKAEGERDTVRAKHDSAQAVADSTRAQAQAAYDAAFNKVADPANREFADQEKIYNDKKKFIDVDGKKKDYDEAVAICAQAQDVYDRADDEVTFAEDRYAANPSSENEKLLEDAKKVRAEAMDDLDDARDLMLATESIYLDAVEEMKDPEAKYSAAATAHQEALSAAASAGDAAKSRYSIPDVPSYDESSYSSSIESAQSSITSAEQSLKTAERALNTEKERGEKRTVKAPKGGNLISFSAVVGASVGGATGGTSSTKSTTSLATIADVSQMRVSLEINEIDITSVKAGQRATVTFASVPGLQQEARVVDVATVASGSGESSGGGVATFTVECVIPKPDKRIKPGMTATITIYTTDLQNVLIVPAAAVHELSDGDYVDVFDDPDEADNLTAESPEPKTTRVKVKVSEKSSSQAVIASGLSEGDVVLVSGPSDDQSGEAAEGEGDELSTDEQSAEAEA